jgi:hypothetical protein
MTDPTNAPMWIMIVLTILNGAILPIVIHFNSKSNVDRKERFDAIHERLNHLDDCMDTTQKLVIGKAATREDIASLKAEVIETMNRMRAAISAETTGLNGRIMRLEDRAFGTTQRRD